MTLQEDAQDFNSLTAVSNGCISEKWNTVTWANKNGPLGLNVIVKKSRSSAIL